MSITTRVMQKMDETIKEYQMINYGDTIVVGVSGGADSVMLLHTLYSIKDKYNLNLIVAHINHKIRIGNAERDAKFVECLCKKWNIEYHLKEANIPLLAKEWKMGEEETGRKVRYGFFSELANGGKIATAHNANDNVETLLMRLMRGSGLKGLGGIQPKSNSIYGTIIRPILGITRDEIEEYLKENNLTHITDETNFEEVYTRNKIRLSLIPYIKESFNPNVINTLNDAISSYNEDYNYIINNATKAFNKISNVCENQISLNKEFLLTQHPSIVKRIIIIAFEKLSSGEYTPSSSTIDIVLKNIGNKNGTMIGIFDKYQVRIGYDSLIVEKTCEKKEEEEKKLIITNDTTFILENYNVMVEVKFVESENIVNTPYEFYIPRELVYGKEISFRTKRDDDVFRVTDDMHKRLNRYMSDKKVDRKRREEILLVAIENEVYCAYEYFVTRFNQRNGKFVKFTIKNNFEY